MENMVAGIFGLIIGITGILTGIFQLRNIARLKSWKTTGGKIIERGTFQVTNTRQRSSALKFAPLVKYVYQVEGREYTNDAVEPRHIELPRHNTVEWAEKRAASFPDNPTIYYNPENPADSFLVPTKSKANFYLIMGASFVVILVSLIFIFTG